METNPADESWTIRTDHPEARPGYNIDREMILRQTGVDLRTIDYAAHEVRITARMLRGQDEPNVTCTLYDRFNGSTYIYNRGMPTVLSRIDVIASVGFPANETKKEAARLVAALERLNYLDPTQPELAYGRPVNQPAYRDIEKTKSKSKLKFKSKFKSK